MALGEAADRWGDARPRFVAAAVPAMGAAGSSTAGALVWAGLASTLHRLRRGEGALPAVNFSLIAYQGVTQPRALASAFVSVLAIGVMYAFNDLYDAPTDANNPKKDPAVVSTYLHHRRTGALALLVLHLLTIGLTIIMLGAPASLAVTGVMIVNVVYSTRLKGVPVVDVIWCGLWGALYAAIVARSVWLVVLVGVMTSVCHLYQTLDDRASDAANAITTTAVRSPALSTSVLAALSALLFVVLQPVLGSAWALTAFTPVAIYFLCDSPFVGWLLTKVYFGVMWLSVLGIARAAG
jgi:4-hydroxybenzoate polyprenyltransferase